MSPVARSQGLCARVSKAASPDAGPGRGGPPPVLCRLPAQRGPNAGARSWRGAGEGLRSRRKLPRPFADPRRISAQAPFAVHTWPGNIRRRRGSGRGRRALQARRSSGGRRTDRRDFRICCDAAAKPARQARAPVVQSGGRLWRRLPHRLCRARAARPASGGGVGLAAVDLAKVLGAKVIAASASDAKLAVIAAEYAPDAMVNVTNGFRERVKEITNGRGADVIYDPVGGDVFDER